MFFSRFSFLLGLFLAIGFLSACTDRLKLTQPSSIPSHQQNNTWFKDAEQKIQTKWQISKPIAKNVIVFIGDGMGVSTVTAARIFDGQRKGMLGEENDLVLDQFPYTGLSKTYNVDAQTPDSAGTMTAMMTGLKTDAGVINVDEVVRRGHCESQVGHELVSALMLAELSGMSTGIVSTARVTHATPAATYARSVERNWESTLDMPESALGKGCQAIANQLINFEKNLKRQFPGNQSIDGIDVVFGGGRKKFTHRSKSSPHNGSSLIEQWQSIYPKGHYVDTLKAFEQFEAEKVKHVLGLFNDSHMRYESDRVIHKDEPSLAQMTEKAIKMLSKNKKGFFLMVESGRIDHAHHSGNAYKALTETVAFSKAIESALNLTDQDDTLVIATADHSHVFNIAGYPKRGNPILGKVIGVGQKQPTLALDGLPYTTVGYLNGKGFRHSHEKTNGYHSLNEKAQSLRTDLSDINTRQPDFHQEALVPLHAETHGGEDVVIYADGPGAYLVSGTNEQNIIFHIINQVLQLENLD